MTFTRRPRATHPQTLRLAIVAHGAAVLTARELAALRQQPGERLGPRFHKLKPQFLKHSEEQTLAALAAASEALESFEVAHDFSDWAIISSTRYLARTAFAAVIDKYQIDGPWGVSVQAIPHGTPHAVASTLSLALGIHGPCIGAGAAASDEPQALLSAASLLQDPKRPGAWLLFSAWSSESPTDGGGQAEAICQAAALAVVNPKLHAPAAGALGHIEFAPCGPDEALQALAKPDRLPASGLTEFLVGKSAGRDRWHCRVGAPLRIVVERPAARVGASPVCIAAGLADQPRRAKAA